MERFFRLAIKGEHGQGAGYVGQITSNSFMKREFGKKLIEEFFAGHDLGNPVDLTHVIDTSGAYIPGHGTPTVILVGRRRRPVGDTVRAVLGIRGEPGQPDGPGQGPRLDRDRRAPRRARLRRRVTCRVADLDRVDRSRRTHGRLSGGGAADLSSS